MPVETDVARHDAQPGDKAGIPRRIEFQQAVKVLVRKSLADMDIAIGRIIVGGSAMACGLIQNRAICIKEFHPAFARIRRSEHFEKRRNSAIAHKFPLGRDLTREVYPTYPLQSMRL